MEHTPITRAEAVEVLLAFGDNPSDRAAARFRRNLLRAPVMPPTPAQLSARIADWDAMGLATPDDDPHDRMCQCSPG